MEIILSAILPFLLLYKYWALFGLTFISSFILPIPPGTVIMASAAFSSQGYFDITSVLVVSVLGNIVGDNASYWFSRYYGYAVLSRLGFRKILNSKRYKNTEQHIKKKAGLIIFFSRFEVSINLIVNIISGIGKISYRKFFLYTATGEVVQVAVYGAVGYFFGSNWKEISALVGRGLIIFLLLAVLFFVVYKGLNKR